MIECGDGCLRIAGAMTLATALELRERGLQALGADVARIDLSAVEAVDSSALAVLLAWQRAAAGLGKRLAVSNPPAALRSIAQLYRLDELLELPA